MGRGDPFLSGGIMEALKTKAFICTFPFIIMLLIAQETLGNSQSNHRQVDELLYDFEYVDRTRAYDVGSVLDRYKAFFATGEVASLSPEIRESLLRNATHLSRTHRILKALSDCEAEDLRNKKSQIKEALLEVRPCPEPTVAPDVLPAQTDGLLKDIQLALEQATEHDQALMVHDAKKRAYRNAFRNYLEFGYLFYEEGADQGFPGLESSLQEFCLHHCGDDIRRDLRDNYESLRAQIDEKIDLGYTSRMSYDQLAESLNERVDALNASLRMTMDLCARVEDAKKQIEIIEREIYASAFATLIVSRASFWGKINPTHRIINPYEQRMMEYMRTNFRNNKLVQSLERLDEEFAQRAENLFNRRIKGRYFDARKNQMDNAIRGELRQASDSLVQQMSDADGMEEVAALTWAVQSTPPEIQRRVSNMISTYGLEKPAAQQFLDTIQQLAVDCMNEASNPRCSESGLHTFVNLTLESTMDALAREAESEGP